ncbi:MAG: acetylxylan esterase [Verrucomicrobiae bacterium]|nr:acetylxylan esterase [Verrucomicrobiae bacterium]MCP5538718.1 acetylxylan esterase [Akkermansiaceae bacterium]
MLLWILCLGPAAARERAPAAAAFRVEIRTERPEATYEIEETAAFLVEVFDPMGRPLDYGSLDYELSSDGFAVLEKERLALTGKPLRIEGRMERPGFLRCVASLSEVPELANVPVPPKGVAAAAMSPDRLTPSRELPADFEAFWEEQKQRLAAVPPDPKMRPYRLPTGHPRDVEIFDTQVRCEGDWPVSGYYARPQNAEPGSLPAVLWVHGAGVRSASAPKAASGAKEGFLSFDLNAHGIANGQPELFYQALERDGRLKNYRHQGRENRDGMYFRGMFLRLVRAVDFLASQPEWDGKTLAVIGHSQGGAQALVAGGLDERVTFVGAGVPAMCDHTGMLRKRVSGWPKLVPILPDGRPDPVIAEVSRYYDAVNFAGRCHAEAIVSVGFIDSTCPPTGCLVAYNQLRGPKTLIREPAMAHAAPLAIQEAFWEALKAHAAARRAGEFSAAKKTAAAKPATVSRGR